MATLTTAQAEALEEGGLSQGCIDNHFSSVCPHCGACTSCSSGCGCEDEADHWQDGWDAAQVAFEANELRKMPPAGLLGDIEALPHQRAAAEEKFTQGWVEFAAEMA